MVPRVFILLRFLADSKFSPTMEKLKNSCNLFTNQPEGDNWASCHGDVGVNQLNIDEHNQLTGWSLLLPLEDYRHQANAVHLNEIPPAFKIGRFSKMGLVNKILSLSEFERSQLTLSMQFH